jgi:hypothetical protein
MASAQYCDPGTAITACDAVLVVCSDDADYCDDVQSTLQSTEAFATVDSFDAKDGTPSADTLANYHAVLVFSYYPFHNASLLGDVLADYHDQGGGVVVAAFANAHSDPGEGSDVPSLQGAYGTPNSSYALADYAQGDLSSPSNDFLGEKLEEQSPLLYGVTNLSVGTATRSTAPSVEGRGVVVAKWGGGGQEPLVLRGKKGERNLVELNFYPASSNVDSDLGWTGDGKALLRNALKYSRCMVPCAPGTYSEKGGAD